MQIRQFRLDQNLNTVSVAILSQPAKVFFDGCDWDVFNDWESRFPNEKSLAGAVSRTILNHVITISPLLSTSTPSPPKFHFAFRHRSYSAGMFLDIFRQFKSGDRTFVIITQSDGFKVRFKYDSSTMTFDSVVQDFREFVSVLEPARVPDLYFIVLEDFEFLVSEFMNRGRSIIRLKYGNHS